MNRTLDRNFVLQKQLEKSNDRLERDFKASQRQIRHMAEDCVSFTYQLLHEAISKEKESPRKGTRQVPQISVTSVNHNGDMDKSSFTKPKATLNNRRIRPQTAGQSKNRKSEISRKRPSSAHPILPPDEVSAYDENRIDSSKPKQAWALIRENIEQNKVRDSEKRLNITCESTLQSNSWAHHDSIKINQRPRTADFYRKKQPENELATFWKDKVISLIGKWDSEDKEGHNIHNTSYNESLSQNRSLIPSFRKTRLTEAEKRLNAFVRRFGSQYRTQMKSSPSVNDSTSEGRRKKHCLTKQELERINADTTKRLQKIENIVKKSLSIQRNMEKNTKYLNEMSPTERANSKKIK